MRTGPCTIFLAVTLAPVFLAQTAAAQSVTRSSATPPATATPAAPACNCPTPMVQRHFIPFSAKQISTHVQTLADGTTIITVTTSQIYRNADGRMRTETLYTLSDGTQHRGVTISDPVERLQMNWTVGNTSAEKIVTVRHYSQPVAQPAPSTPQIAQRYYPTTSELLPPQTIDGLYATGNRSTRTTPAGYEGNDRDITVTAENWSAPSLGIVLRQIHDDPRNGKTTTEFTDIQQTAPDPALFKAPEGYQIRDTTPAPATSATPATCNCTTPVVQPHFRPYIAIQRNTLVRTQTDGTTITTITQTHIWRDAEGRTRLENFGTLPDGTTSFGDTNVYDPVERVRMSWSIGNSSAPNIVTVRHFPQPAYQPAQAAPVNPQSDRRYFPQRTETLPPQTIDGLYATGTRTTRTIPAGYEGNDRNITTTQERWYSPDLGIQLRYITNDPRNGKATTEVTDIQQIAPDPALFKAPEGYQVKDANP